MTVPTRPALGLLALGLPLCLIGAYEPRALVAAVVLNAAVGLAVLFQGRRLRRQPPRVRLELPDPPQARRPAPARVIAENPGPRARRVRITLPTDHDNAFDPPVVTFDLAPRERVSRAVELRADRRGVLRMPAPDVAVTVAGGLAAVRLTGAAPEPVTVYPSLSALGDYETLSRSRAYRAAGYHRQRQIGAGREFEQLREYLPGDDYRDVNWKATARSGVPRTNLYQTERSRDVLLCVDGGRFLNQRLDDRTLLDHAIDAALLLSRAAADQGDRVGLITFRERVETVVRPSTTSGPTILRTLAGFEGQPAFPGYLPLVEALRSRQSHRALVFLFTDLNDPQLAEDLAELMPRLAKRHLVVVVSLRDGLVDRVARGRAADAGGGPQGVQRVLAAARMNHDRHAAAHKLTQRGVQVLEADAERLGLDVINRYLAIKARQLV